MRPKFPKPGVTISPVRARTPKTNLENELTHAAHALLRFRWRTVLDTDLIAGNHQWGWPPWLVPISISFIISSWVLGALFTKA